MVLSTVLTPLQNYQLYAKPNKCELWLDEVRFLGHVVTGEAIIQTKPFYHQQQLPSNKTPRRINQYTPM